MPVEFLPFESLVQHPGTISNIPLAFRPELIVDFLEPFIYMTGIKKQKWELKPTRIKVLPMIDLDSPADG